MTQESCFKLSYAVVKLEQRRGVNRALYMYLFKEVDRIMAEVALSWSVTETVLG